MRTALRAVWAVILTGGLVQLANGLQTDLLGVRAGIEKFPAFAIGYVMAGYYVGYSAGPLVSRFVIRSLGHVRTIWIAVTVAAASIALHGIFVSPAVWTLLRIVSGLAISVNFVAVESWINDRSENRVRGRVFSIYMVWQMGAMTIAQYLLTTGDPSTLSLFLLSAGLFIVSSIPVLVLHRGGVIHAPPEPFSLLALFRIAPLGAAATVLSGVSWAIVFTFGPVYAQRIGMTLPQIGFFMGVSMVTGALVQFPLGWVSDHVGRRLTIGLMTAGGAAAALFGVWAQARGVAMLDVCSACIGALVFPLYGIAVAHANDAVQPSQRVAAAAGLVLIFGLGSIAGPLLTGWAIGVFGSVAYFYVLAIVSAASVTAAIVAR
ncbi:MAG TPA: MFS transporter [Rhizomicrobium sp.]|nr:MFS transporter [Rhizomicrobium sp.]